MSESIFVRIGHVGGHIEELQVFSEHLRSKIDALLQELNTDADIEHDRVFVSDQHGDNIEVCATGLMTFSTEEGLKQTYYRAASAEKVAEIVTDFLLGMFGEWWAHEFVADDASLPRGAPVFGPNRDPEADWFLHKAAYAGNLSVVRALVLAGHDVNRKDGSRDSPLVCAVLGGHFDVCELLLKNGADVTARSGLGTSLLRLADEHPAIADLLRAHGARD